MIKLGVGITGAGRSAGFDPSSMFNTTSTGLLLRTSYLTTLSQDAAGTTPASAPGQPVGLVRDLSGGNRHASQATSAARPTLGRHPRSGRRNLLTWTEDFSRSVWGKVGGAVPTGVVAAPDGSLTAHKFAEDSTLGLHSMPQTQPLIAGATYTQSVYLKAAERGFAFFGVNGATHIHFVAVNLATGALSVATGSPSNLVSVESGDGWWRIAFSHTVGSSDISAQYDVRISTDGLWANRNYQGVTGSGIFRWGLQLELGSVATPYQKVTTAFDVTEPLPQEPRRNLLDWTEDFLNPAWTRSRTMTVTGGQPDPFGGNAAARVQFTAANQVFSQYKSAAEVPIGSVVHTGFWIKGVAGETIRPRYFSPLEENVTLTGEWQYLSKAVTSSEQPDRISLTTWGGATARDVLICRPQLEFGTAATAYQRIADQYSNPPMVPSVWYLSTDAIDDWLATAAFEWGSDEVTIVAAMRKRSDAAPGRIVQVGFPGSTTGFSFASPANAGADFVAGASRGSIISVATTSSPSLAAPLSAVLTMQAKVSADQLIVRSNGNVVATSSSDQGSAASYGNQSVFIGQAGGGSFAAMDLYALFAINRLLSPAELAQVERWAASEMGVTL